MKRDKNINNHISSFLVRTIPNNKNLDDVKQNKRYDEDNLDNDSSNIAENEKEDVDIYAAIITNDADAYTLTNIKDDADWNIVQAAIYNLTGE